MISLTPNNIVFHSRTDEYTNRILTRYKNHLERFVKVTFCDIKFQKALYCFDNNKSIVRQLIAPVLKDGLVVSSHTYKFLCYS